MESLHKMCMSVMDVKPLPTGDFELKVFDLETKRDYNFVITPGNGCYLFAPGYFFYIQFYRQGPHITVAQQQSYRDAETCLRKSWSEAMHGPSACDEIANTPKNTFKYFLAGPELTKGNAQGRTRHGKW